MEVNLQNPDDPDSCFLYESVIEEVTLEGLDGITLQALFERLVDREGAPISRGETQKVLTTIWNSIKKDERLRFYLLPTERPDLQIWNRNVFLDIKGKFEEPANAPADIYPYKCIEIFEDDERNENQLKKHKRKWEKETKIPLSPAEIKRISLPSETQTPNQKKSKAIPKENEEFILEGIRFYVGRNSLSISSPKNSAQKSQSKGPTSNKSKSKSKTMSKFEQPSCSSSRKRKKEISSTSKSTKGSKKSQDDDEDVDEGIDVEIFEKSEKKKKTSAKSKESAVSGAGGGGEDGDGDAEKSFEKIPLIRGSCEHFETRRDVSRLIRTQKISFFRATQMFANRLVVVASQFLRDFTLFGKTNLVPILGPQYCLVERVGRARHHGEQARGKTSLTCMKIDAKTLFYYRKSLLADGLITKQGLVVKFPENRTGSLISVFHLPHFFRRVDSAESINIRKVFAYICNSPSKTVEFFKLQHVFGKYLMRLMAEEYRDIVDVEDEVYAKMYPSEYENEPKQARKDGMLRRKVRVMRLKNPETGIRDVIERQLAKSAEDDDTPMVILDTPDDDQHLDEFDWTFCYNNESDLAHEFEASQVIRYVVEKGSAGFLLTEFSDDFGVTNLDSRSASRYLQRWKVVKSIYEEHDRTKIQRYFYAKYDAPIPIPKVETMEVPVEVASLLDEIGEKTISCSEADLLTKILQIPVEGETQPDIKPQTTIIPVVRKRTKGGWKKPGPVQVTKKDPPTSQIDASVFSTEKESEQSQDVQGVEMGEEPPLGFTPIPITTVSTVDDTMELEITIDEEMNIKTEVNGPASVKPLTVEQVEALEDAFAPQQNKQKENKPKTPKKKVKRKEVKPKEMKVSEEKLAEPIEVPPGEKTPWEIDYLEVLRREHERKRLKENRKRRRVRNVQARVVDDTDKLALTRLKKQRVDWSGEEDRLVLHAFISSILFIPRYNMEKILVFNSLQIRDLIHSVSEVSRNKTSGAVRRRIHQLMKSPVFHAKYRSSLCAALKDDYLYEHYIEKHMPPPTTHVFHKIELEPLKLVFDYVRNKFDEKSNMSISRIDSWEEVAEFQNVTVEELLDARELRRLEKVWVDIWGNVFREIYRMYKHKLGTPENTEIDKKLETQGFVLEEATYTFPPKINPATNPAYSTIASVSKPEESDEAGPPGPQSSPAGVELSEDKKPESETETATAETKEVETKVIAGKAPVVANNVYSELELDYVYEVARGLFDSADATTWINSSDSEDQDGQSEGEGGTPQKKPRLSPKKKQMKRRRKDGKEEEVVDEDKPPESRFITLECRDMSGNKGEICSGERNAESDYEVLLWTGRTAMLSVIISGHTMETVLIFMASIPDSTLARVLNSLRALGMLSITRITKKMCLSFNMKRKLVNYLVPAAFRVANCLLETCAENGKTDLTHYNHLGSVYLLGEISPLMEFVLKMPEWIITVHEEWKDDYFGILNRIEGKDKVQMQMALRLLRSRLNADNEKGKFVEKDFFDINLPQLEVKTDDYSLIQNIIYDHDKPNPASTTAFLQNSLIQIVEYNEERGVFGTSEEDLELGEYKWLYDIIKITETIGISLHFLLRNFEREDVRNGLLYLIDCNYIYMVGVRHRKYVAAPFMKNWTQCVPNADGTSTRMVVMRPWIDAKGEMNWRFLDRAYVGILGILQRYSMLMVNEICRQLQPLLSHLEVFILLSTLVHFKVIDMYKYNALDSESFDLFSNGDVLPENDTDDMEFPYKDYDVDALLDMESLWVELMPFHVTKYSQIQQSFLAVPRPENPQLLVEEDLEEVLMINEGCLLTDETLMGLNEEGRSNNKEDPQGNHNEDPQEEVPHEIQMQMMGETEDEGEEVEEFDFEEEEEYQDEDSDSDDGNNSEIN